MDDRHKLLAAVHLILEREGEFLLLRRFNIGYEDGNYSVVAGHIDGNERAHDWQGNLVNMEVHKCDDLSWFAIDGLPENMVPYVKHALEQIQEGNGYSEFGW